MLGELDSDELRDTTLNPKNRFLTKVVKSGDEDEERMFEVFFRNKPELRKQFMRDFIFDKDMTI